MIGHDVVVHLAALPRIQPSIENPRLSHNVNLTGTLNVLEAARQVGVKHLIYGGSSSIFGKGASIPMREDDMKNPGSPYAFQKLVSEGYLELYRKLYGLMSTTLRFFNVFGKNIPETGPYALALGIFINQKEHNQPLTIKGTGLQRRDFTWVGDICNGIILAGQRRATGTFHLGSGTQVSINDLADAVDPSGKRIFLEASQGDYPETLADISKAQQQLSYQPTTFVFDWLKENLH